jgi:hypothetical protein
MVSGWSWSKGRKVRLTLLTLIVFLIIFLIVLVIFLVVRFGRWEWAAYEFNPGKESNPARKKYSI